MLKASLKIALLHHSGSVVRIADLALDWLLIVSL